MIYLDSAGRYLAYGYDSGVKVWRKHVASD
jgi:hypothetical protein